RFYYVYFHRVPSPTSVFEGVHKLQAGNIASLNQGQIDVHRYWQPTLLESNKTGAEELHLELKSQLHNAVASSIPAKGKVGAFLSGGLDSSTVQACWQI
ncbi:MAG: asparagine synthase (glutamine-hydrolyzing), partial [Bacteroidia bacterium]